MFDSSRLVWEPKSPFSRVEAFRKFINRKHGKQLVNYHDLHDYSVQNYTFWIDLAEFLGVQFSVPPHADQILAQGKFPEIPTWFPGSRLNYAENLLQRKDDAIAITASNELGVVTHYTFRQLRQRVTVMAAALRVKGLRVGDRVAAIITNSITAVVIALAVAGIGGVYSGTATDMGTQGILDRYVQIQPRFVFAETEVVYSGKTIDLLPKVADVAKALAKSGLETIILLPSVKTGRVPKHSHIALSVSLDHFLSLNDGRDLVFQQLPFNQPLFILYSSGTSGPPKCIVHSAGGVLLQTMKEIALTYDINTDDTYLHYTTTGWMMWTYMLSTLALGSRLVIYDGSPFYPNVESFLKFVNDQGVSVLGISPRFLGEVQGKGIKPSDLAPFDSLRSIMCTGAVLTAPLFEWAQNAFSSRVHLVSGAGGTDVCTAFVTGTPALPVYAGEIQVKSLGMKIEIFDPFGKNIEGSGEPGELVCTRPHPSLPLYFWGDQNGSTLRKAYFEFYPGVWRQGDFIVLNPATKGMLMLGRSDGVLNPSGVRFGSGEIYAILEDKFAKQLDDSLCIGQRRPQDMDERVLLFLKMRGGCSLTKQLDSDTKYAICVGRSMCHVPSHIFAVQNIPVRRSPLLSTHLA